MEATTKVPSYLLQYAIAVFGVRSLRIARGNRLRLFPLVASVCPSLLCIAAQNSLPSNHICLARNQCNALTVFSSRYCRFTLFLIFLVHLQPLWCDPHSRTEVSHSSGLED